MGAVGFPLEDISRAGAGEGTGAGASVDPWKAAVRRAFGDAAVMRRFVRCLRAAIPAGTRVVLRGSSVAGVSYLTGRPFDADGPGTSDLDIVLIGDDAMSLFVADAFYVPAVNSRPVCDEARWAAPALDEARSRAQAMVHRPVAIQAMAGWFFDLRVIVQGQPYLVLDEARG